MAANKGRLPDGTIYDGFLLQVGGAAQHSTAQCYMADSVNVTAQCQGHLVAACCWLRHAGDRLQRHRPGGVWRGGPLGMQRCMQGLLCGNGVQVLFMAVLMFLSHMENEVYPLKQYQ